MKKIIAALLDQFKTLKSRANHPLFIPLSHGNKKLKNNARVSFLIWNLPAVITCPYATAHCKKCCYALKAERNYPACKPCRERHFELSRLDDFVLRMVFTISAELARPVNKNKKIVFRIHESGDFYNKEYVKKWFEIMDYFKDEKRLVFVAYTKSVKYFDGIEIPENMRLLASVWDDTTPENLEIIKRNNFRIYTAYAGADLDNALKSGFAHCPCKDCGTCGLCWNNYTNNICCEIH